MSGSFPARAKLADIRRSGSTILAGRLRKLPTMHNAINGQSLAQSGVGAFFGQHGISAAIGIALASLITACMSAAAPITGRPSGTRMRPSSAKPKEMWRSSITELEYHTALPSQTPKAREHVAVPSRDAAARSDSSDSTGSFPLSRLPP
jgi:hypothetical protein